MFLDKARHYADKSTKKSKRKINYKKGQLEPKGDQMTKFVEAKVFMDLYQKA